MNHWPNRGIIAKTIRDSLFAVLLAAVGLIAFVVLFTWAMMNMGQDVLEFVAKFPFLRKIFEMSLGIKVEGEFSLNVMFSVCFTHGVVLATTWGVLITIVTRVTVGEVDRGTADLLLTLPVSRLQVILSTTLVWLIVAVLLSGCPIIGIAISKLVFSPDEVVVLGRFVAPAVNFLCVNLVMASIAMLLGCVLNQRSSAVGIIVGVALVSVVLNFLEPFLEFVKYIRFMGLLSYFQPVETVRSGEWPVANMLSLLTMAAACWSVGTFVYCRKDIPTA